VGEAGWLGLSLLLLHILLTGVHKQALSSKQPYVSLHKCVVGILIMDLSGVQEGKESSIVEWCPIQDMIRILEF
jgi:hypothetical protein